MKIRLRIITLATLAITGISFAADQPNPESRPSLVDISRFSKITQEASEARSKRLVEWAEFEELAGKPGTIILDTRSRKAFVQVHLKGAVHLNFSDFTATKLAEIIPEKKTTILIYCNNNFSTLPGIEPEFAALANKLPPLALNIPTFINLYGYGYTNIYELAELLNVNDPRIELQGTVVSKQRRLPPAKNSRGIEPKNGTSLTPPNSFQGP